MQDCGVLSFGQIGLMCCMVSRQSDIATFLHGTIWQDWATNKLPVDASARSYQRLTQGTESVILMDAPPDTGEDVRPFIKIANHLVDVGLSAPRILKMDVESGFLLLEDLGATDFATVLKNTPENDIDLYRTAADVLLHLRQGPAPDLTVMSPAVGGDMVRIVGEFYVSSKALADDLAHGVEVALASNCGPPEFMALRDFHAENLIWRPNQSDRARVGLLDFQDAFIAPDGYDLASLLRDARRDVRPQCADETIRYYAQKSGQTERTLKTALATLSVQRNLRILGVFGRLIQVQKKHRYIPMLPRVWAHIMQDLEHPALAHLQAIASKGIPDPTHSSITVWTR